MHVKLAAEFEDRIEHTVLWDSSESRVWARALSYLKLARFNARIGTSSAHLLHASVMVVVV